MLKITKPTVKIQIEYTTVKSGLFPDEIKLFKNFIRDSVEQISLFYSYYS